MMTVIARQRHARHCQVIKAIGVAAAVTIAALPAMDYDDVGPRDDARWTVQRAMNELYYQGNVSIS